MILGPVTHAGSQWRRLCAKYNLDPLQATAETVEAVIRQRSGASVHRDLVTTCIAAEAFLGEDPAHPEHAQHRLALYEQLSNAISAALQRGD